MYFLVQIFFSLRIDGNFARRHLENILCDNFYLPTHQKLSQNFYAKGFVRKSAINKPVMQ